MTGKHAALFTSDKSSRVALALVVVIFCGGTRRVLAQQGQGVSPGSSPPESVPPPTSSPATPPAAPDFSTRLTGDWWGARRAAADNGVTVDLSFVADGTKNLLGGLDTAATASRTMVEAKLRLDTQPLLHLAGGTIFADFQVTQGENASDQLVGDLQGIDNLDGVPGASHQSRTQLAKLWYQQVAFDNDALRIKVGKADANAEFDHVSAAQEFLQQSYGSSATLFTLPTYPDPAMSVNVFVKPTPDWQIGVGVYDGSLGDGINTGSRALSPYFHHPGDLFLIGEIDKSWKLGEGAHALAGRAGVGGWYSTNTFTRLDGATVSGTGGPYALAEQALSEKVHVFVMYGYGDPTLLPYDHSFGAGVTINGPIPSRKDDIVGVGVQAVHFSDTFGATGDYEVNYELFYRAQLTGWMYVKPDLQYIANPGGQGASDALALTVRVQIDF